MPRQSTGPEEARTTFNLLCEHVCDVGEQWGNFRALVPSEKAASLLRRVSNDFFVLVQATLSHSVIMSLGRLCDPPTTSEQDNLSFPRLFELTDGSIKSELAAEIKAKWQALGGARKAIRAFRNKRLAHNDLAFVSGTTTIESVQVRDIDAVLRGMRDILENARLARRRNQYRVGDRTRGKRGKGPSRKPPASKTGD